MDIHKPKPWHGVREFLKEYLIIVIGVLTALAAEQGAEWLHWRHAVEQERETLSREAVADQIPMYMRRDIEPCVAGRIAELDELFRRHDRGESLGKIRAVGRPSYVVGGTQAWDVAVADGSLAHMPKEERDLHAFIVKVWRAYDSTHSDERTAWIELKMLDHPEELTPTDWSSLRRSLEAARDADEQMRLHIREEDWLWPFRALHAPIPQKPRDADSHRAPSVVALCRPMLAAVSP